MFFVGGGVVVVLVGVLWGWGVLFWCLRSKLHKRLQRVGRLALRVRFEHLADRNQCENHRG